MKIHVVQSLSGEQVDQLHTLYQGECWSRGRTSDGIRTMLAHTDLIIGLIDTEENTLAGFARVLTDRVYKAMLFDVIVHPAYRSQGLGKRLLDEVLQHPDLQDVAQVELYCLPEMEPFYRRWGFISELGELTFMRSDKASPDNKTDLPLNKDPTYQ